MDIIATVSKNSYPAEKVEEIIRAGAAALRYNFSHGTPQEVKEKIENAREVMRNIGRTIPVLADLPGNKLRLGSFPQTHYPVEKGQRVTFEEAASSEDPRRFVPINTSGVVARLNVGKQISCVDGEIGFEICEILSSTSFTATAMNAGTLSHLKGVSIGAAMDELEHLTSLTLDHIAHLRDIRPEWIAFSFVRGRQDMERYRDVLEAHGVDWNPQLIAKIETPKGVEHAEEIAEVADMLMVARGDLGLTIPFAELGLAQKHIIRSAKRHHKKAIVATQLLESILTHYVPVRAEILDITNCVLDGADAIMFAKETGMSFTPGYSIEVAKQIIEAVQRASESLPLPSSLSISP